ncbi:hypothetical protein [Williamsia limnetica]|nr:hypothetical protein [Williamsia limnetica]
MPVRTHTGEDAMTYPRTLLAAALSAVAFLGLAACGSSDQGAASEGNDSTPTTLVPTQSQATASGTASPATSPTRPAQQPILQHSWEDDDGYTYQVEIDEPTITVTSDTLNSKPGHTDLTWRFATTARLTNTTPGRNAPFPENLSVQPVWAASTPLCTSQTARTDIGVSSNDETVEDAWCTLTNMPMFLAAASISEQGGAQQLSGQLTAGETMELASKATNLNVWTIPESDYATLAATIKAPTLYVLGASYTDRPDNAQCLLMTGVSVFTETQRTGCLT